jgi:signal transduction histidine kinase/ActR/RegA family two-component response regulator
MRFLQKDASETVRVLRRLTFLVLLIPILCFAAAAWKDRSAILQTAESDGVKIVALLHEQAENLFAGHQIILDMIVDRVKGLDWDTVQARSDLLHELEVMDRRLDGASEILLVDASGRVRATTVHTEANELLPPADRRCFLVLSRNEVESCISQPYADPSAGHYMFSLSQRLAKDGQFNGIAQVAISADYIVGLWASATPSVSDIVTMFKADGTVLAQSGPQSGSGPSLPDLGKSLIEKIGDNQTGIIRGPLLAGGVDRITVYAKLGEQPVYIGISLDKGAILTTWFTNLTIYGLVAASAMAGIIVAFGMAMRRAQSERRALSLWQAEIEERVKAQEQLRQSQKMESLGKLTGGIAHDFNNLLTVIVGNLGLVKRLVPGGKAHEYLQTAMKASESAVQLTTRLLAFARKQVLAPKAVDLPRLLDGMEDFLLRTLGHDVKLRVSCDPGLWPALVDPNQIELIVLNLAINARDAMPKGGTLTIKVSNGEFGPGAPHDLAPGQYVVVTVTDTGTGMDAATLARATEPFFSTKEVGKGTGLGLSMMQGFVTQSGGASRLRSQPGCGTQIEMWLPRARVLPEELKIPTVQDQWQDCGSILVCDDDPAVLQFICSALETKGYQALSVTNGRSAIAMLEMNKSIRLLVLDFTMPEMNGAAVIRALRVSRPDLPVLLVTGNANLDAIQNDLPDTAVLAKPFDYKVLTRRVSAMLEAADGEVADRVA